MRAYTVHELDELRSVVSYRMHRGPPWSAYETCRIPSMCYETSEKGIEERVRTHMLAGHTADDVRAAVRKEEFDAMPFSVGHYTDKPWHVMYHGNEHASFFAEDGSVTGEYAKARLFHQKESALAFGEECWAKIKSQTAP